MRFMAELQARAVEEPERKAAWDAYLREHHALAYAIENGTLDDVRALLAAGADPDGPDVVGAPCMLATAASGSVAVLNAMLDAGASIDAQSSYRTTALWIAANVDDAAMARALLARGANPTLANDVGEPPWSRCNDPVLGRELREATDRWPARSL